MDQDAASYGARPRPRRLCAPPPQKGADSPPPEKSAYVYCGQTAGWMKLVLGTEVGLSPGDFVLDGDPAPSLKRGRSPQIFGPYLLWPNGWMDRDASWHERRPQPRRLCVRRGPSPLTQKGSKPPPQFSAHFFCGQTARCIEMPLGMDVGLSPADFVLDRDPVTPPQKVGGAAKFSAHIYCDRTAGWIKMPLATRRLCFRWGPSPYPKGVEPLPNFRPISVVAKRLDASRCHLVWR